MLKKILYITNFSSKEERSATITNFSLAAYKSAISNDFEFHINTNNKETICSNIDDSVHLHLVEIYRNPFSKATWIAYKQLMKVLSEEHFDVIHCNTPIGGFLGRVCGKKKKIEKIIYQVHGFHFYKGSSKLNWLLFYPIERWLAHYTDVLITINQEDYIIAQKFQLKKNGKIYLVPGVGIDLAKFSNNTIIDKISKRNELGFRKNDFLCIAIGRLDSNKNFGILIKAISKSEKKPHLLICGDGMERDELEKLAISLNVQGRIHFLGYRSDIYEILTISDCYVSSSKREGLPRSLMEAMACGLPCIVSRIRGNSDLIKDGLNGICVEVDDIMGYTNGINRIMNDKEFVSIINENALQTINKFSIEEVITSLEGIYKSLL